MKRWTLCAILALCSIVVVAATVPAAELTNSNPTSTEAHMPASGDFSNGPQGGGAELQSKDHIPSSGEFANGPSGGAAPDPSPRRMPNGGDFSNGPAGISQE